MMDQVSYNLGEQMHYINIIYSNKLYKTKKKGLMRIIKTDNNTSRHNIRVTVLEQKNLN